MQVVWNRSAGFEDMPTAFERGGVHGWYGETYMAA